MVNTLLNAPYIRKSEFREEFRPWLETGENDIDWMVSNLDKYIFDKNAIIGAAQNYSYAHNPGMGPQPGVYFLIKDERVVYVGLSKYISNRVKEHHTKFMPFNRVAWIGGIPEQFLETMEVYYIYEFEPPLNNKVLEPCVVLRGYTKKFKEKAKLMGFGHRLRPRKRKIEKPVATFHMSLSGKLTRI